MDELVILYTTWPDAETAQACGRLAVERRLAACANLLGPMRAIYRWDGAVQCETEIPMLLKTTLGAAEGLRALVLEQHPYDTPCVLALDTHAGIDSPAYTLWVQQQIA